MCKFLYLALLLGTCVFFVVLYNHRFLVDSDTDALVSALRKLRQAGDDRQATSVESKSVSVSHDCPVDDIDELPSRKEIKAVFENNKIYALAVVIVLVVAWKWLSPISFAAVEFALLKLQDVGTDILSMTTYFIVGAPVFLSIAVATLFISSSLSFAIHQMCNEESLCSPRIILHWTQLCHVVTAVGIFTHQVSPGTLFIENFFEFTLEAAPQSSLTVYAAMVGVGSQTDVMGLNGLFVLQCSTIFSLVMMVRQYVAVSSSPYGPRRASPLFVLRVAADVVLRIVGTAAIGNAMRPLGAGLHYWNRGLLCALALGYLHCLEAVWILADRRFRKFAPVWAMLCWVCTEPPPMLKGLRGLSKHLASARLVELLFMLAWAEAEHGFYCTYLILRQHAILALVLLIALCIHVVDTVLLMPDVYLISVCMFCVYWYRASLPTIDSTAISSALLVSLAVVLLIGICCLLVSFVSVLPNLNGIVLGLLLFPALVFSVPAMIVVIGGHPHSLFRSPLMTYVGCMFVLVQLKIVYSLCVRAWGPVKDGQDERANLSCSCLRIDRKPEYEQLPQVERVTVPMQDEAVAVGGPALAMFGAVKSGQLWLFCQLTVYVPTLATMKHPATNQRLFEWAVSIGCEHVKIFASYFSALCKKYTFNEDELAIYIGFVSCGVLDVLVFHDCVDGFQWWSVVRGIIQDAKGILADVFVEDLFSYGLNVIARQADQLRTHDATLLEMCQYSGMGQNVALLVATMRMLRHMNFDMNRPVFHSEPALVRLTRVFVFLDRSDNAKRQCSLSGIKSLISNDMNASVATQALKCVIQEFASWARRSAKKSGETMYDRKISFDSAYVDIAELLLQHGADANVEILVMQNDVEQHFSLSQEPQSQDRLACGVAGIIEVETAFQSVSPDRRDEAVERFWSLFSTPENSVAASHI